MMEPVSASRGTNASQNKVLEGNYRASSPPNVVFAQKDCCYASIFDLLVRLILIGLRCLEYL